MPHRLGPHTPKKLDFVHTCIDYLPGVDHICIRSGLRIDVSGVHIRLKQIADTLKARTYLLLGWQR
jgi:hypothetical protein